MVSFSDGVHWTSPPAHRAPTSDYRPTEPTTLAVEAEASPAFELATALPEDSVPGISELEAVDGDTSLPWRTRYTPAQRIVLFRALIFLAAKPQSKQYYDKERFSELPAASKEVVMSWKHTRDRDLRLELIPAGLILVNILVRGGQDFDSDAFIADVLEEARLFGDQYEMYAWEPPDKFWHRWRKTFPYASGCCSSLRPWLRLRRVVGATPYQIIMGTATPDYRIDDTPTEPGEFGLPEENWSANDLDGLT